MEFTYFGANCLRVITKDASILIDYDKDLSKGVKVKDNDILLYTQHTDVTQGDAKIVIDKPGEYEVSNVSIMGIPARAHMDESGPTKATIYKLTTTEIRLVIVGHIYPELSEDQLEAIGTVDVMVVPVGGNGYTLDSTGAAKVVKAVSPKIIIPTHYDDGNIAYEVPQQSLEDVLKNFPFEAVEPVAKYKIKSADVPELPRLVVLEQK